MTASRRQGQRERLLRTSQRVKPRDVPRTGTTARTKVPAATPRHAPAPQPPEPQRDRFSRIYLIPIVPVTFILVGSLAASATTLFGSIASVLVMAFGAVTVIWFIRRYVMSPETDQEIAKAEAWNPIRLLAVAGRYIRRIARRWLT